MSDALDEDSRHRRPHPQPMVAPFLEFDLTRELEQLYREPEWTTGQNAKTLVKYDDFRIVLTTLRAHARIAGHRNEGRISIHTVHGHIRMRALGRTFDLPAGSFLALDQGLSHDVEALEDSAFLLTIAWPARNEKRAGWERSAPQILDRMSDQIVTDSGSFLITAAHSSARGRRDSAVPHQTVTPTYTDCGIGLIILCSFHNTSGAIARGDMCLTPLTMLGS